MLHARRAEPLHPRDDVEMHVVVPIPLGEERDVGLDAPIDVLLERYGRRAEHRRPEDRLRPDCAGPSDAVSAGVSAARDSACRRNTTPSQPGSELHVCATRR